MRAYRGVTAWIYALWLGASTGLAQTGSTASRADIGPVQGITVLVILVVALGGLIVVELVRQRAPGSKFATRSPAGRAASGAEQVAPEGSGKEGAMTSTERNFLRAVVTGFIATFTFTMAGFWQAGIGVPKLDVASLMAGNMGHAYVWGQAVHFLNGIVLALIYAFWLYHWIPGPRLIKGVIYGILTTIAAGLIVVPLVSAGTPEPTGIFFSNTPMPGMMVLAAFIVHLVYGITLGLGYKPSEETSP